MACLAWAGEQGMRRIVLDIGRIRRAAEWAPSTRIEDGMARMRCGICDA